jgi:hypothetical protein
MELQDDPARRLLTEAKATAWAHNAFERAYRKRIIHSLPFMGADYGAAKALWGDHYPQAFAVDAAADDLFIVSATTPTAVHVVTVYSWETGAYKSVFAFDASAVSEGAVVKSEADGKRYLYVRTATSTLSKFDVTALPANLVKITPAASYTGTAAGVNFTYRNGIWTANDSTPPIGDGVESRGYFKRLNDAFQVIGQLSFPESYSGGNSAGYRDNSLPKMQGFTEADGFFAESVGGYYAAGAAVTPYSYQGLRILSPQGEVLIDALLRPDLMIGILAQQGGLAPSRIEAEGVLCLDGSLYSLNVTSSYSAATGPTGPDNQGILILEELSGHPAAIDFAPAAITWTQTPVHRTQTGIQPRGDDGKMHNAVTHEVLDTVPKILAYMRLVGQSVFRFYSSSASVLDLAGTAYPAGNMVTIYNANNITYFLEVRGPNAEISKLVSDGAGGYTRTTQPAPAASLLRLTSTTDASATSTGHAFQVGPDTGENLIIDGNEIMARSNGAVVPFYVEGGILLGASPTADSAARKDYVDAQVATRAAAVHTHNLQDLGGRITAAQWTAVVTLGAGVDLNNQTSDGRFNQPNNGDATLVLNYPAPYAGKLTVDVSGSNVYQTYQTYSAQNRYFFRSKYSSNPFGAWQEFQVNTGRGAYAVAAGTVSVPVIAAGATTTVTITYPASRFSVAPVLNLVSGEGRVTVGAITANSATSATVTLCNYTAAASVAATGNWQAKQMTSTTAAG